MNRFSKFFAALAAFAALAVGGSAVAGAVTKTPVPKPATSHSQEKGGDGEQNDATEKGEKADGPEKGEKADVKEKADKGDGDGEKKDDAAGKQDTGDGDGENPNR